MHVVWYRLSLLAAALFILAGCASSDPHKAPKHPEEYNVPPTDDARYSQPPNYPKDVLNQDRNPITGDPNSKKGGAGRVGGNPANPGAMSGPGGPGGY